MSRVLERPDCEECAEAHGRAGSDPPCDTCTPALLPENRDVVKAYLMVCNQVIIAPMGGVVDINIDAVDTVVRRLNVDDPDRVFGRVISLARHFIKKDSKENA